MGTDKPAASFYPRAGEHSSLQKRMKTTWASQTGHQQVASKWLQTVLQPLSTLLMWHRNKKKNSPLLKDPVIHFFLHFFAHWSPFPALSNNNEGIVSLNQIKGQNNLRPDWSFVPQDSYCLIMMMTRTMSSECLLYSRKLHKNYRR